MYADHVTDSMAETIKETERRRALQAAYNAEHGITPETIRSSIRELLQTVYERDYYTVEVEAPARETFDSPADLERRIAELDAQMKDAARRLDFEHAAELRDRVRALRRQQVS
jgi:excinuclease ABC subunit B